MSVPALAEGVWRVVIGRGRLDRRGFLLRCVGWYLGLVVLTWAAASSPDFESAGALLDRGFWHGDVVAYLEGLGVLDPAAQVRTGLAHLLFALYCQRWIAARLRDLGQPGGFAVPVMAAALGLFGLGPFVLLLALLPGDREANRFGAPCRQARARSAPFAAAEVR
ncbi:MAG TPA: hypothetical protein VGN74_06005 [Brevundimonas sp.]|jgi:uncharacterized membrane protein YhaH (DUF805 family)|uniref:hypothetical protein n=1 Tax=Brevundimonas sp. TaxID=1871086 RepID=UPI002E157CC1|nr:hypothetical protein [Brevundimonas sp.]